MKLIMGGKNPTSINKKILEWGTDSYSEAAKQRQIKADKFCIAHY